MFECYQCERLVTHLDKIRDQYPNYHNNPVSAHGKLASQLLIVGLAPGLHGANASGIPFTGDASGDLLFKILEQFNFAYKMASNKDRSSYRLDNCRITNAVKCLPPQNKPIAAEINQCNAYLVDEIEQLHKNQGDDQASIILALGQIAHKAVIKALDLKQAAHPFKHGNLLQLSDQHFLIDSYHCSRYNIQTRRLTEDMFRSVFTSIKKQLKP